MDVLTLEQRKKNMRAIKSSNTKGEVLLRKSLWKSGLRYRKNYALLPGKPDIIFPRFKIAIFCDGEFWHGKNWEVKKARMTSNREYWIKKIERNMSRDQEVNISLQSLGWDVLRFWEKDIVKNIDSCIETIKLIVNKKTNKVGL